LALEGQVATDRPIIPEPEGVAVITAIPSQILGGGHAAFKAQVLPA
jgi:hypothetical protein